MRVVNPAAHFIDASRAANRQHSAEHDHQVLFAMMEGEVQRAEKAKRAKVLRKVAIATRASGMRVAVYISELAIGVQLALYGQENGLFRAMVAHNRRLNLSGVKGVFEQ